MLCVPAVPNDVFNVAVAPARVRFVCEPPDDVTVTGLPMAVAPLKNVTVPVGPVELTLLVEIVALNTTGAPAATVVGLATTAEVVGAFVIVVVTTTGVVTAL
jgi:hypothetical protein